MNKVELRCSSPLMPHITLEWDDGEDAHILTVNGKAFPALTVLEIAGLFFALRTIKEKADADPGDAAGSRGEQAES